MTSRNTLFLYSTTVSDTGYVRSNNQDSSFAGERLIAICDGMGGHAGGDTASTIAVRSLAHIEKDPGSPQSVGDVASLMETSVIAAHDAIVGKAKHEHKLAGMGTTVTAVTLVEDHWVLAHIGDSRAYLLRNGRIIRATKDHSYVQHLIDTGRITPAEAKNHPQRNVVMRVLGDFDIDPRPDISVRKAQAGDRWMLCSDGVCGVLSDETIRETLETVTNPQDCAQRLVGMALKAGSTDNCTAVIADANIPLDPGEPGQRHQIPLVAGAVSADLAPLAGILGTTVAQAPKLRDEYAKSPAQKAAELAAAQSGADAADSRANAASNAANGYGSDAEASGNTAGGSGYAASDSADMGDATASDSLDGHAHVVDKSANGADADGGSDASADSQPDGGSEETPNIAVPQSKDPAAADEIMPDTSEIPIVKKRDGTVVSDPRDPVVAVALAHKKAQDHERHRKRLHMKRGVVIATIVVIVGIIAGVVYGAWHWSQSQYYIGESDGYVAVYQGVNTNVFGMEMSHIVRSTKISVSNLSENTQQQLQRGVTMSSQQEAEQHLAILITESNENRTQKEREAAASASASASASPSATASASAANSANASASPSASASATPSASASGQGAAQ
ncbi:PP2C family protein-serine/threonine phosphatase [Pseudoscardovia suis]|uniref:PP2C family protein-serine/threonine phosphatase n=1 Tax=Pseudoscardovia suis TaxID=987063 RepID=UPI003F960F75